MLVRSQVRASKLEQDANKNKFIDVKLEGDDWTCIESDEKDVIVAENISLPPTPLSKEPANLSQDSSEEIVDLDDVDCDLEVEQDPV